MTLLINKPNFNGPATDFYSVSADDDSNLPAQPEGIYVGTQGDLRVQMQSGEIVTFTAIEGFAPIQPVKIFSTGTTATDILAIGGHQNTSGISFDADAETLFAAWGTDPGDTRKAVYDTTYSDLKSAGIYSELDELWIFAAHAEADGLLGLKRYKDCTAVNAPTFTTDRGFAGDGSTSYLNTNFTPSADGVKYQLNDASLGVYSRTEGETTVSMGGGVSTSSEYSTINPSNSSDLFRVGVNQDGLSFPEVSNADARGFYVARRAASGTATGWKNGSQVSTASITSAALPSSSFIVGAFNSGGVPVSFSIRQHAAAFVGASLTAQQQSDLFDIIEAHLDAIGAGVVS